MTPDPSLAPIPVWITGFSESGLDEVRLLIFTIGLGFFVAALLLSGVLVSVGLRR